MSDHQSRAASDDLYDHEREEPRSGRRRRPVADWGVGEDMFDHMPRNRFSRAAEGPPRERRFSSRAAEADRSDEGADRAGAGRDRPDLRGGDRADLRGRDRAHLRGAIGERDESADELAARREARAREWDEVAARDDSERIVPDEPIRWTGPFRDGAGEDETPRRGAASESSEGVPRGRVQDGRRTIVIGKPEDVPSEIAAITADRDLGEEDPPEVPAAGERRTVRIGGHPEGSLEAARLQRARSSRRPPPRAHERLGARPDRIAMWAFALGLLLIVIAILSAH